MRCPKLKDLPEPPLKKTGWPWTEESPQLPDTMPDGSPWPRVSIVTPSYNQGEFLEETIRSVLLQGYPNLEYIIIDGGSQDNSVEIIKKYEPWLAYWVSEPDKGQAHAINKGFKRATGKIVTWLNSDDIYAKMAFKNVLMCFSRNLDIVYGDCEYVNENGRKKRTFTSPSELSLINFVFAEPPFLQPSVFFKSALLDNIGYLNEDYHYRFDSEYWIRLFMSNCRFFHLQTVLSYYRIHSNSKTVNYGISKAYLEDMSLLEKLFEEFSVQQNIRKLALLYSYWRSILVYYSRRPLPIEIERLRIKIKELDGAKIIPQLLKHPVFVKELILVLLQSDLKRDFNNCACRLRCFQKEILSELLCVSLFENIETQLRLSYLVENFRSDRSIRNLYLMVKQLLLNPGYSLNLLRNKFMNHNVKLKIFTKMLSSEMRQV